MASGKSAVTTGYEDARETDLAAALHHGRCVGTDPEVFFPEGGHNEAGRDRARAICQACPVRRQCLELTLRGLVVPGIWAGTTGQERQWMRSYRAKIEATRLVEAMVSALAT